MSAAYIVVHNGYLPVSSHVTDGLSVVGAYSGFQAAFDVASKIVEKIAQKYAINNPALLIKVPKEQKQSDGSVEWVFMTSPHTVLISFRQIESPVRNQTIVVEPKDDPEQRNLPAGWDYNGKPITVEEMLQDPSAVKEYDTLTTKEIVALVTARIRKRPNFVINIPGCGILNRDEALLELSKMSHIGDMIIANELLVLNRMLFDDY